MTTTTPPTTTTPGRNMSTPVRIAGGVLLLAVALGLPWLLPSLYWLDMAILVLIWAAAASAWNLSGGYAGGLSLGHAAFFGIGAYTSTLLLIEFDISPWLGMLVGAAIAGALGFVLGALTFRLKGPFFVLITLAFGIVIHLLAVNWRDLTRGSAGLLVPGGGGAATMTFDRLESYWYLGLGLVAVIVGLSVLLERSRLGYYLAAVREDEEAARSLGVRVQGAKLIASTSSAALTALAGTFYAQFIRYIDPSSTTQFELSVQIALIAIVGGLGTAYGPLIGAAIVIPLSEILRVQWGGGPALMIYGLLLIVIVLVWPSGAAGALRSLGRRLGLVKEGGRDAEAR